MHISPSNVSITNLEVFAIVYAHGNGALKSSLYDGAEDWGYTWRRHRAAEGCPKDPYHTARSKNTEALEQSMPSVLDSTATTVLASLSSHRSARRSRTASEVTVTTPAPHPLASTSMLFGDQGPRLGWGICEEEEEEEPEEDEEEDKQEKAAKAKDAALPRVANGKIKTAIMCSLLYGRHGPFAPLSTDGLSLATADMFFLDAVPVAPTRFRPAAKMGNFCSSER
ncbi:hypothetical protein B0H14DRAFT_3860410 [Mycena olivaceomarginata]|nr:hypothetical protein B0H14DRAFT_3860410 [Mycena olivaceomarginata]